MARSYNPLHPNKKNNILVASFKVEYENVFHFKNLYKKLVEFLSLSEGFEDIEAGGGSKDKWEYFYKEAETAPGFTDHFMWWRCEQKKNEYFKYVIRTNFRSIRMGKTEVMHQGKKYKTYSGDVIIFIDAYLVLDYKQHFSSSGFMKFFDTAFKNRIYKGKIDEFKEDLYRMAYRYQNEIKQYLELNVPYDLPPSTNYPKKGIGDGYHAAQ